MEAGSTPPHILFVEDDPASRDMLSRRLASRGFRVTAVESGEECVMLVKAESRTAAGSSDPVDLVLLDVNLPGMTGLDVLREVRRTTSRDTLPVIMVTALADTEHVVAGLAAGANDYVTKPVQLPVLVARLQVGLQIKHDVELLMEAERQRVMIETLGSACEQIAQPMTAITVMLETLIRQPPSDLTQVRAELSEVLSWTKEAGDLIHRLRAVAQYRAAPYTRRVEMLGSLGPAKPPGA